jgi:hypothetical protein
MFKNFSTDYNMCRHFKKTGVLCGRCLPEHYPLAYSYDLACAKCQHISWNWVRYIMAAYLPLTLFYLVIIFCKTNVVSSHLHPLVLFSQGMSIPPVAGILLLATSRQQKFFVAVKVSLSLYGIWNLDFFRPFYYDLCLGIGILPTLALDYAIAVYPLLLMIISYLLIVLYDRNYRVVTIMWRPFQVFFSLFSKNWEIRTSLIDAFSTFFLLTNIKFLSVSFYLLVPTRVYHLYGDTYNYTWSLFYAPDIEYFGREHLPYAILAIVVLCALVILPITILALYPFAFFQKFLNLFPVRWYILHTFVDAFQGCYKDGTEPGTRDYRWFSAVYLAFRSLAFLLYGITQDGEYFPLCSILMLFGILLLVALQPYKKRVSRHLQSNAIFCILYVMFYGVIMSMERIPIDNVTQGYFVFVSLLGFIITLVPLLGILGILLYWLSSQLGRFIRRHRRGYLGIEDDGTDPDAYCDRVVNPQAYPTAPSGQLVNYNSPGFNGDGF